MYARNTSGIEAYKFKPGQSGNPGGRSPLSPELKAIKPFSQNEIARVISKYGRMLVIQLTALLENDSSMTVMDRAIAGMFMKAIEHRDFTALNFLLDRAVGKVPQNVIEEDEDSPEAQIRGMPLNDLLSLVKNEINKLDGMPE